MGSFRFSKNEKGYKKHALKRVKKAPSRKEKRKKERAAKKRKNVAYFSRKKATGSGITETVGLQHQKSIKRVPKRGEQATVRTKERQKTPKGVDASRKSALVAANNKEDKEIAKLEKLLKLKKRKKLPTSFSKEGLDYLLDLSNKDSTEWNLSEDDSFDEGNVVEEQSSSEPEDTVAVVSRSRKAVKRSRREDVGESSRKIALVQKGGIMKKNSRVEKKMAAGVPSKRVRFSTEGQDMLDSSSSTDEEVEESLFEEQPVVSDLEEEIDTLGDDHTGDIVDTDSDTSDHEIDMDNDGVSEEELESPSSDGYIESGDESEADASDDSDSDKADLQTEVVAGASKYVPPHLRSDGKSSRNIERLKKRVQGLVNRLSESNMKSVSSQLEQLYLENSRNDMNTTLTEVLMKACVTPVLLGDRFAMEHVMLVVILHTNVGPEIGAHIVQSLAVKLDELLNEAPNYGKGKECDCVVLLLAHLYNYRVIHCLLIYDVIRKLVDSFTERDVELLLLLLKNTGMEIRKDDASSLKDIILQIQSKAASSSFTDSSRMRFMLGTISALRTNNVRKIPNYDPSLLEHMKKLLRGIVRTTGSLDEGQLKISWRDLLNASKHGRWWIVGSAWTGRDTNPIAESVSASSSKVPATTDSWVLELARKQRMNTDVRKNIFCVLMTSEDYADAFEKLLKLGLKEVQEREIVHVLVDCCLQERTYNQYYAFLAQKMCEFKRSHQVTFQFALWDRFKALDSLTSVNRSNLSKLTSHLISNKALSLAVLRVAEFGKLDKVGVKFYKHLLSSLLLDNTEDVVSSLFSRIAPLPHLKPLRDELLVFMKHYLTSSGSLDGRERGGGGVEISERVRVAERAMRTEGHLF